MNKKYIAKFNEYFHVTSLRIYSNIQLVQMKTSLSKLLH